MKKILNRWENISIKYKLFYITSGLLIALALIIYLILYNLLPSYYHKYKIETLETKINSLIKESRYNDTNTLKENLAYLAKTQNLSILLTEPSGNITATCAIISISFL